MVKAEMFVKSKDELQIKREKIGKRKGIYCAYSELFLIIPYRDPTSSEYHVQDCVLGFSGFP
jgi:hypothetical protein